MWKLTINLNFCHPQKFSFSTFIFNLRKDLIMPLLNEMNLGPCNCLCNFYKRREHIYNATSGFPVQHLRLKNFHKKFWITWFKQNTFDCQLSYLHWDGTIQVSPVSLNCFSMLSVWWPFADFSASSLRWWDDFSKCRGAKGLKSRAIQMSWTNIPSQLLQQHAQPGKTMMSRPHAELAGCKIGWVLKVEWGCLDHKKLEKELLLFLPIFESKPYNLLNPTILWLSKFLDWRQNQGE